MYLFYTFEISICMTLFPCKVNKIFIFVKKVSWKGSYTLHLRYAALHVAGLLVVHQATSILDNTLFKLFFLRYLIQI